jgi:hypothetical protein
LLQQKIVADVPHAQWVFSIPKMLRPYFYSTGIAVIQTFGSSLGWNPHIHAIVTPTRGLSDDDGTWQPIPYVDTHKAELLFRHKLLRLLRDKDLITQERIDLLLSWKNSGFGVHNHTTVYPNDTELLHPGPPKPWRRRHARLLPLASSGESVPTSLSP